MFLLLSEVLESSPHVNVTNTVTNHLSQLTEKFMEYFPEDPRDGNLWILDPFSIDPADVALPTEL